MTLLLGPPGSGKTTLLRALTGRLERDRYTRLEGEVTHNGHPLASLAVQRSSAYVDQVDQHLPALTVRETLKFAERCLGGSVDAQDLMRRLAEWEAANGIEPTKEDAKARLWPHQPTRGPHPWP
jgi:ABC-type multidrug transport system ATPase subunit